MHAKYVEQTHETTYIIICVCINIEIYIYIGIHYIWYIYIYLYNMYIIYYMHLYAHILYSCLDVPVSAAPCCHQVRRCPGSCQIHHSSAADGAAWPSHLRPGGRCPSSAGGAGHGAPFGKPRHGGAGGEDARLGSLGSRTFSGSTW